MGRRIATSPIKCAILLSVLLVLVHVAIPVRAQPLLISGWMTQPVTLDGKITTAKEWSDTVPVDLALRSVAGVTISARIWIKNDLKWLCILATGKWPLHDIDRRDCLEFSVIYKGTHDVVVVFSTGEVTDGCKFMVSGVWSAYSDDIKMSPPGTINVEGGASHNGTHYWFELRRELNSGDHCDVALVPGETYFDAYFSMTRLKDPRVDYVAKIVLRLAPVLPSIDATKPEQGAISRSSQVDFKASISGHLSKVTLFVGAKEHDMAFSVETGLYEASLTLADGVYKWRVNARGVLGNVTSIPERSLTVDTAKPVVTIRSPTSGEVIRKSEVLVSWEALDATSGIAKVEVKVDASDWVDVTGKTSYTALWVVEGNHEVRVRATDRAGNVAEQSITFSTSPPPWYATYWYVPLGAVAAVVAIAAAMKSRGRPPKPAKPPEVKPLKIERPPKPPTREELLKELEELYRSGRIAETTYRRLKKKYETKTE